MYRNNVPDAAAALGSQPHPMSPNNPASQSLLQDYFAWTDVSKDEEDLAVRWVFSGHSIFDNPWGYTFEQGRRQDFITALRSYWIVAKAIIQRMDLNPFLATEGLIAKCEPEDDF